MIKCGINVQLLFFSLKWTQTVINARVNNVLLLKLDILLVSIRFSCRETLVRYFFGPVAISRNQDPVAWQPIFIFPIVLALCSQEFDEYTEMAASLPVSLSLLGWQKFDLTTTVRTWYSTGTTTKERLRLLVDCSGCGDLVEAVLFRSEKKDPQRPFLVVHTDPTATRRVRRRALDCSGALKGQCCKQRFFVSFKQLGWEDWIIAPSGYYANYCQGNCGGAHRTPDTFLNYYTHVMEEYRKLDHLTGMQPCCAPVKFSSMSLIYFGPDSNIIKRDLPKMVVDECGCP
jgi:inhibin beta